MFFIQRKWIPHESPINMLCGYKDTETVQLYGNIFVWNINWRGIRADFINSRESKEYCDWYDISTGTRGKWRTHLYDDAHIPVLGVNEFLFHNDNFAQYDTRNMQWYLGDDSWMQNGNRWYGYSCCDYGKFQGEGNILQIKKGYNAWSIISSEAQQVLSLIGYRKPSYPKASMSEKLLLKAYTVDVSSDQKNGIVILNSRDQRDRSLTFEQLLIQHCWDS